MGADEVESRLKKAYEGSEIEVKDLSGEGSYYEVSVASSHFEGMTRIKQHQSVMSLF